MKNHSVIVILWSIFGKKVELDDEKTEKFEAADKAYYRAANREDKAGVEKALKALKENAQGDQLTEDVEYREVNVKKRGFMNKKDEKGGGEEKKEKEK